MKKAKIDNADRRQQRAMRVANGTWMGRNAVHRRKTDYNRQRSVLETKRMAREEV